MSKHPPPPEPLPPVIKSKTPGLPPMPPSGCVAWAVCPDGNFWSIWKFHVKDGGDLSVSKEVEMLRYDDARLEVGRRLIQSQSDWLK